MCVSMYTTHTQYRLRQTYKTERCKHGLVHINNSVFLGIHTFMMGLCEVSPKKNYKNMVELPLSVKL